VTSRVSLVRHRRAACDSVQRQAGQNRALNGDPALAGWNCSSCNICRRKPDRTGARLAPLGRRGKAVRLVLFRPLRCLDQASEFGLRLLTSTDTQDAPRSAGSRNSAAFRITNHLDRCLSPQIKAKKARAGGDEHALCAPSRGAARQAATDLAAA